MALAAFTREWTKDKQQRRAERERDLAAKRVEAGRVGVVYVTYPWEGVMALFIFIGLIALMLDHQLGRTRHLELSPKVGDDGNRKGGISWGCLTPPLLHRRSDMPCPKITSSS